MKDYEEPKVEIIRLDANDVICTSGCSGPGCPSESEEDELP